MLYVPFILATQGQMPNQPTLLSNVIDKHGLDLLEIQVQQDLLKINIPRLPWIIHSTEIDNADILDVAIIGGGMAVIIELLLVLR